MEELPEYRVQVDGFEVLRGSRHVVYYLTVVHGNTRWPLRRRFRQVYHLHEQISESLGRSQLKAGLPKPPPKVTPRSLLFGQFDDRFLQSRAIRLQQYFEALLRFIPLVDQCEALREFLCSVDVNTMSYDALLDLEQAIGRAVTSEVVDPEAIAALPSRQFEVGANLHSTNFCVICQENFKGADDIRTLPCGHEYHYNCIAQWIPVNNTCCVCQGVAVQTRSMSLGSDDTMK